MKEVNRRHSTHLSKVMDLLQKGVEGQRVAGMFTDTAYQSLAHKTLDLKCKDPDLAETLGETHGTPIP